MVGALLCPGRGRVCSPPWGPARRRLGRVESATACVSGKGAAVVCRESVTRWSLPICTQQLKNFLDAQFTAKYASAEAGLVGLENSSYALHKRANSGRGTTFCTRNWGLENQIRNSTIFTSKNQIKNLRVFLYNHQILLKNWIYDNINIKPWNGFL